MLASALNKAQQCLMTRVWPELWMEIVAIKVYLARPVYSIYSRTIFMDGSRIRNFYYLNKTFTYYIPYRRDEISRVPCCYLLPVIRAN